jgi:hypothetical protein
VRNWPHQDHCVMCNGSLETGLHLCLLCPVAKKVWCLVLAWEHFDTDLIRHQTQLTEIRTWWEQAATKVPRERRRHFNGVVIYTMWNIWKERNRRIFQDTVMDARQVALKAKEDTNMHFRVFNNQSTGCFLFLCLPKAASWTYRFSCTYNLFSSLIEKQSS